MHKLSKSETVNASKLNWYDQGIHNARLIQNLMHVSLFISFPWQSVIQLRRTWQ